MPTLALIHTVHGIIPEIESLCAKHLPGVRTAHFLDETVLRDAMVRGGMDSDIAQRVCELALLAERGGADAILVTCSSIGPSVDAATRLVKIPVRRIDAPMAAQAVRRGGRIAVAATVGSTLDPTASLIQAEAKRMKKRVQLETALFANAFEARIAGDARMHDSILERGLGKLTLKCDTLVLAQASMARAAESVDRPANVRILSSPASGVKQMKRLLV